MPTAVAKAGRVAVEVDYAAFAHAYGGDWASRLRLVELPACALTTPKAAKCRSRHPAEDPQRRHATSGSPPTWPRCPRRVPACSAGGRGAARRRGSDLHRDLAGAVRRTWQVAGQTGDFTW